MEFTLAYWFNSHASRHSLLRVETFGHWLTHLIPEFARRTLKLLHTKQSVSVGPEQLTHSGSHAVQLLRVPNCPAGHSLSYVHPLSRIVRAPVSDSRTIFPVTSLPFGLTPVRNLTKESLPPSKICRASISATDTLTILVPPPRRRVPFTVTEVLPVPFWGVTSVMLLWFK